MAVDSTPKDLPEKRWTSQLCRGENPPMPAHIPSQITGLILAGGLGRRMGGVDKGLQILDGRPLIAHVIERLRPQVDTLLINANRNADAYETFGYQVIADQIGGFAGPLAGIHAGLARCATPLLATVPCDSPRLPRDLISQLLDALLFANAQIAIARTATGLQPVFALMKCEVLPSLTDYLVAGKHRMQDWCRELALCEVDFPDDSTFANINTRDDLSALTKAS
jgi:molybdenum cofactor guanylyltransferase